jgi:hypothetical protein
VYVLAGLAVFTTLQRILHVRAQLREGVTKAGTRNT